MKKYKNIVSDLENKISTLKEDGVKIDALDDLLQELTSHVEEVTEVEEHIDAIRGMVISPIKKELEENKQASQFSIWGFYVGAIGLLASVLSLLYTSFTPAPELVIRDESTAAQISQINQKITEVRRELYLRSGKMELNDEAIKIKNFDKYTLVKGEDLELQIQLYGVSTYSNDDKTSNVNVAHLKVFYNERLVSHSGVPDIIQVTNVGKLKNDQKDVFAVAKGDVVTVLGEHQIQVLEVLNSDATYNALSDKEDAIIISTVSGSNKKMQPTQKPRG
ncbi:hypothetical protein BM525_08640 [Alteromonas mediterranea]|uniref:hypothetical protein n=1 Tax=Alteromonas mediterranea TaxID=314275 RepID=UPI0009033CF4|nr:hypothetical protein [Alteromonas mediterranea]APD97671.1 hypothetical protein BM525_08640 [Alteromonas mediterranea]